jgi:dolichyl-phosphate beta-glucosyltransferase
MVSNCNQTGVHVSLQNLQPNKPYLSVVVPAYNEENRLGPTLEAAQSYLSRHYPDFELLVVDDGSTDATAGLVAQWHEKDPRIQLLQYDGNHGKGFAVRYGMMHSTGDFALFMDADLATPIEEVEKVLASARAGADVAIGSRDVPGSVLERRESILRELGGKIFNRIVQTFAVPGIRDTQCGFKLFRRSAVQRIFAIAKEDGYAFDVELLFLARRLGLKIDEVPIRWHHHDGSKISPVRDAVRMLKGLARIRSNRYPLVEAAAKQPAARDV